MKQDQPFPFVTPDDVQRLNDGYEMWASILKVASDDRSDLLKNKLTEYAIMVNEGEKNADVYMALVMFLAEVSIQVAEKQGIDPNVIVTAMQLGLSNSLQAYNYGHEEH